MPILLGTFLRGREKYQRPFVPVEGNETAPMGSPPEPSASASGGERPGQGEGYGACVDVVTLRLWATRSKPYDCGKTRPGPRRDPSGFPLRSRLTPLPITPQRFLVTPRALRHGTLLTAPPEMPPGVARPVFRSARFAVRLLPGAQRFPVTLRLVRGRVAKSRCGKNAAPPAASPVFSSPPLLRSPAHGLSASSYPFNSNLYPTPQTVFRLHWSLTPSSFSRRRLMCTSTVRESPK